MKYIDLFAGLGGFRYALDSVGMECILTSEIDERPKKMYETIHNNSEEHKFVGDIIKVDSDEVPDHDLMVGGITCQGFSYNGKRTGFEHKTGNLFFEVERLAREKKPNFVLIENVMGLLTHDKGFTISAMIKMLSDIGYKIDFELLNARWYGLPQQRRRVFLIATLLGEEEEWNQPIEPTCQRAKKRVLEYFPDVKTFNFKWDYGNDSGEGTGFDNILDTDETRWEALVEPDWFLWQSEEDKGTDFWHIKDGSKAGFTRFEAIPNYTNIDHAFNSSKTRRGRVKHGFTKTLDIPSLIAFYTPEKTWRKITPLESFRLQGFDDSVYHAVADDFGRGQLLERPARSIPVPIIQMIGKEIQRMKEG